MIYDYYTFCIFLSAIAIVSPLMVIILGGIFAVHTSEVKKWTIIFGIALLLSFVVSNLTFRIPWVKEAWYTNNSGHQ